MLRIFRALTAAVVAAAAMALPALAAPHLQEAIAQITSPTDGQIVSGLVPILGTVTATDFLRYEIAFGPDPNPGDSWTTFAQADIMLVNAQIGLWDANLPSGVYALRLRVFRSDNSVAAEDFVNGLIVGEPPTPTPEATPTGVPPAPTFGVEETAPSIQPTIVIEQPPPPTPEPTSPGGAAPGDDQADSAQRDSGSSINLGLFTSAFVDGVTCAFGAFFVLGALVVGRWGLRLLIKQMRERSGE